MRSSATPSATIGITLHGREAAGSEQTSDPYGKASKADKGKIFNRVAATTGMGRSTTRRMLTGPRLADPGERPDGRTLRRRRLATTPGRCWSMCGR